MTTQPRSQAPLVLCLLTIFYLITQLYGIYYYQASYSNSIVSIIIISEQTQDKGSRGTRLMTTIIIIFYYLLYTVCQPNNFSPNVYTVPKQSFFRTWQSYKAETDNLNQRQRFLIHQHPTFSWTLLNSRNRWTIRYTVSVELSYVGFPGFKIPQ